MNKIHIIISVIILGLYILYQYKEGQPKIGDVWRYVPKSSEDPFRVESKKFYDYKILDIKDDYILYMDLSDSITESSTVEMFKVGSERLNK